MGIQTSREIIFAMYVSRSGSSLILNELSKHPKILSLNEWAIPPEYIGINGFKSPAVSNSNEARQILSDICVRSKLSKDHCELLSIANLAYPITAFEMIITIMNCVADSMKPEAEIIIYKGDPVNSWWFHSFEQKKNYQFLLISRDPRGIYNSQQKSRYAYSGGCFSLSPYQTCKEWLSLQQIDEENIIRVEFEYFLSNQNKATLEVLEKMQLSGELSDPSSFGIGIPIEELHLHENLSKSTMKEKASEWNTELSEKHKRFINSFLKYHGFNKLLAENSIYLHPTIYASEIFLYQIKLLQFRLSRFIRLAASNPKAILLKLKLMSFDK